MTADDIFNLSMKWAIVNYISNISLNTAESLEKVKILQPIEEKKEKIESEYKEQFTHEIFLCIERFLEHLEKMNIFVDIQKRIKYLRKKYMDKYLKDSPFDEENIKDIEIFLELDDAKEFHEETNLWRHLIGREINSVYAIFKPETTIIDKRKVLKMKAKGFFKEAVWEKLPVEIKQDLDDSLRCMLISAWTPCAMVAIRATEFAVNILYKNKTMKKESPKWNDIILELKKMDEIDKALMSYLDYLRQVRNSLQHPPLRIDAPEAETVFIQAINSISIIFKVQ